MRMEILAREMVEQCDDLPLAIVVLGSQLGTKNRLSEWEMVQRSTRKWEGGQGGRELGVLCLSYHDLLYWLKACFLYLGIYPEDFEIDTKTLYQLWIAKGIVSSSEEEIREEQILLDVVESLLGELAHRCMVQVQEEEYPTTSSRRFRT
ncbi:hypothetical protein ACSBR1_013316 [Camellia fascicularis]